MAGTFNKVTCIARLTRDPEFRNFAQGGGVTNFGIAMDGPGRKDPTSGKWENDPVFVDCSAFNPSGDKGGAKLADLISNYCVKGDRIFIEGMLVLDQWTDQSGQNRQKLKIRVQSITLLEKKSGDDRAAPDGDGERKPRPTWKRGPQTPPKGEYEEPQGHVNEDIPF